MEDSFNKEPELTKETKTSSTDSKDNDLTTGDSQQQDGAGVAVHEEEKTYEKSDEQQEYIEDANNNTAVANESPVQDGKSMTMSANIFGSMDGDDDDDDDNEDPLTEIEIGDDPDETSKKLPVM
jgi:hypothetical protein